MEPVPTLPAAPPDSAGSTVQATVSREPTISPSALRRPPGDSPRVVLQRRAARNIRNHWIRDATRVTVLATGDVFTFAIVRELIRLARDRWLGEVLASWLATVFPPGFLGGWQFAVALLLSLLVANSYGAGDRRRDPERMFAGAALAGLITLYAAAWTAPLAGLAVQFVGAVLVFGTTLAVTRGLVDMAVRRARPGIGAARTLLVAQADADWRKLATLLASSNEFVVSGAIRQGDKELTLAEQVAGLAAAIERSRAEVVLLWGDMEDEDFALAVDLALASGCRLLSAARRAGSMGVRSRAIWVDGTPLVELSAPSLSGWQLVLKRTLDIVGATAGLLVTAPLCLIIAVAIKLDSRGPVFFRQVRVGKAGKLFRIIKFRSMVADAEQRRSQLRDASIYGDQRLFKVRRDPRVTRVGALLRKTSLDELPQLINVFLGDMSFVGPRPPVPSEVALYDEHHFCRFDVKPGITGPWQVSGRNTITDFEAVIRLESEYIRTWSLLKDLRILCRTVPAVLRMRGAH